ncbi:MAG: hypothetical protein HGJ93_16265 [Desulfosarcina sp.]|nr:hypothetical protein [Desulfosarcina sp.]MBC2767448.1 hypothetical protein [Desulfosarcina sp.]
MFDLVRKSMLAGVGLALKAWDEVEDLERVEKSVKNLLKKADVLTQDDLKGLKKEIRDLKKLISSRDGEETS